MNDVAMKVLKAELEPELLAKFEAFAKDDAAAGAMDPALKQALKGMLQLMASFKDKLQTPQLQALAHLVGFTGNLMNGSDAAPDATAASADSADDSADDMDDGQGDGNPFDPSDDDTAVSQAASDNAPPADPTGKPQKPASSNPFGKKDAAVNKAFEAFKKKADAEAAALRKSHDELRKAHEATVAQLRKKEVSEMVAKKYPNLGSNAAVTEMVLGLEKQGLLGGMEQKLAAWNNQLGMSDVFKEMGAAGEGDDLTPEQALNKKADELRKQHPGMSHGVAYTKAYDSHPELAQALKAKDQARRNGG